MPARTASSCSSRPTCATCSSTTRRTSAASPSPRPIAAGAEGSPVFVLASFQSNKAFFNETNKVGRTAHVLPNARAPLQDAANTRLGVRMSSRPWDVRLRRVTWEPVPTLERAPARAPADPARAALRGVVLRLAAEPGPGRHPLPLRHPDRGRALQPDAGARLLVDRLQRAGAREARHRAGGWPSTCSSRSTRSRRTSST